MLHLFAPTLALLAIPLLFNQAGAAPAPLLNSVNHLPVSADRSTELQQKREAYPPLTDSLSRLSKDKRDQEKRHHAIDQVAKREPTVYVTMPAKREPVNDGTTNVLLKPKKRWHGGDGCCGGRGFY